MAVIAANNLVEMRRRLAEKVAITGTKAQLSAAFQAVEDTFTGNAVQNALFAAIEAQLPGLTNPQKRRVIKAWMLWKFGEIN